MLINNYLQNFRAKKNIVGGVGGYPSVGYGPGIYLTDSPAPLTVSIVR
jgi:hypothetical protein